MLKKTYLLLVISVFLSSLVSTLVHTPQQAFAVTAADWRAGKIIDDTIFTDKHSMNVDQIQNFLNQRVGTGGYDSVLGRCDFNGERNAQPFSSSTRANYAAATGKPTKFTCLNSYYEVPKTVPGPDVPANNYGGKPIPVGAKSAAQLIWDAAQQHNISPKVLLVTIQKESAGPLTTDDWPFESQYKYAMGAHCPDSGPGGSANCDPNYAGFSIQISESAALFRWYLDSMSQPWWSYKKIGNNSIQYHPNTACGSSNVYIETKATAALYTYTPYQPNQSALNNLYGSGDSCGAYGNRNFWRIYNDWFGSTTAINGSIQMSKGLTVTHPTNLSINDEVTASFEIQNLSSIDEYVGGIGVCARINGENYDFGFNHHQYIAANSKLTITYSKKLDRPGSLFIFQCSYHPSLGFASTYYPYDPTYSLSRQLTLNVLDNPLVTSGISLNPVNPAIGQEAIATVTLRNTSASPMNIGSMVVAARDPQNRNVDFGIVNDVVIPASGTYTYSQKKILSTPGIHKLYLANWNGVWKTDYPRSENSSVVRKIDVNVLDSPLVTSGITLSPANPVIGQPVTAKIVFRNTTGSPVNIGSVVVAGRDGQGRNVDFGLINDVIIPANGTTEYSQTRTFSTSGTHTFFIAQWKNVWSRDYPKSLDSSVLRQTSTVIN